MYTLWMIQYILQWSLFLEERRQGNGTNQWEKESSKNTIDLPIESTNTNI